jgi:hypothetical protein
MNGFGVVGSVMVDGFGVACMEIGSACSVLDANEIAWFGSMECILYFSLYVTTHCIC